MDDNKATDILLVKVKKYSYMNLHLDEVVIVCSDYIDTK